MNNDELKKKIAQIIADYFCPQKNEHKNLWGDDRLCYSKTNFAECERVTECTDALIAAGIGDVKDLKAQVGTLEMTNIFLQAGYDDAEKDRLYWVNKYKEAEHRADVAEKALKHAVNVYIAHTETSSKKKWWYKYFLREAEKELAEEESKDAE